MKQKPGCFFFQAEDGIRVRVRSRGLGDVYKSQLGEQVDQPARGSHQHVDSAAQAHHLRVDADAAIAVSYTHLTLPTSDLV